MTRLRHLFAYRVVASDRRGRTDVELRRAAAAGGVDSLSHSPQESKPAGRAHRHGRRVG